MLLRHPHRVFKLAENLRLAQYHRIQPASHAKSMAHGGRGIEQIKIGGDFVALKPVVLCQPADNRFVLAHAIQLGAVAGRQNHRFFGRTAVHQLRHGFRQHGSRKRQPLANAQRGGLVVEADGGQLCHDGVGKSIGKGGSIS